MSKENDFLELLQCEFSAYVEKVKLLNEEFEQYGQDVTADIKKSSDVSEVEDELDDAKNLRDKTIENLELHKNLLENGASLKLKHQALVSQNKQLSEKILKKTARVEREKAVMEAQKQNIESKRLVIKSSSELFRRILGLEILVLKGSRMQFLFKNLIPDKPDAFAYIIVSLEDMMYSVMESYPKLDNLKAMEDALNKTNNIAGFIQHTRSLLKEKLIGTD